MSSAPAERPPLLNIANVLTGLRLALVPVFLWALFAEDGRADGWRWLAFWVFVAAALTDRFDGELARRRGLVTEFGAVLDPIADKALTGSAFLGLSALELIPWWVTVVIIGREIGVTLLRFWVIRLGVIPASRGGKAKTFVQALVVGLYLMPLSGTPVFEALRWSVLAVAIGLTVVTGLDYVLRALRMRAAAAA